MNKYHKYLTLAAMLFAAYGASAQNDSVSSTYNESVIVVGDYNPVLDGVTEKVNVAPAVNDNAAGDMQPKFTYSITPRRISSMSATSGIKAAKVLGSPTKLYNNYLRFGLGHDFAAFADFNPLMDLYYTSTRHDDYAYGARFFHETDVTTFGHEDAAAPSPDHYGRTRLSDTRLDLFGKYILNKKHLFSADLAFDRQYGRYYGFSDSTLVAVSGKPRDSVSFSDYAFAYNSVALGLGARSLNTEVGSLGYEANMQLADMWGRYDFSQLSAEFDASVHYGFPFVSKYKAITYLHTNWKGFSQKRKAVTALSDMPLGFDAALPLPAGDREGRHLVTVGPCVDFLFRDFKVHAGLALGINAYDDTSSATHNLFPDLTVSKSFSNNSVSLSAGFRGDYNANDWNSVRQINPFVAPAPSSLATVDNNLYAHLRVNFSKKLMLKVSLDNHFYQNALYFELDPAYTLHNVFRTYFVDENELLLSADFTFVNDEMITLTLGGCYSHSYNVPDNVILLYNPDFSAHLDADINYKDKWLFSLNTLFMGSMDAAYAVNAVTGLPQVTMTLPARFGLALGAEYIHSRALSFFAKFDNLTFQRYFIWANYPAPRFNALVGLTYTIPN